MSDLRQTDIPTFCDLLCNFVACCHGAKVFRTVSPIQNRPECHGCHHPTSSLNGVIITDFAVPDRGNNLLSQAGFMILASTGFLAFFMIGIILIRSPLLKHGLRSGYAGGLGSRMAHLLLRPFGPMGEGVSRSPEANYSKAAGLAKEFIDANYTKNISRDDIVQVVQAARAGYRQLERRFKEEVGCPLMCYLHQKRVEKAKELLADPRLSIKQVSAQLGYDHQNAFTSIFAKYMGCTPKGYRRTCSFH